MEELRKKVLLLDENDICGDLRKERNERDALDPAINEPLASITVGCSQILTLICC